MKIFKRLIGVLILVVGAAAILYLRFSNPEMTETQLFVNHWFNFLVAAVCVVYGLSLLSD